MVERIQDLNLPNANITKLIKDALPPDVNIDKEGRIAIARATSVFIMYLSSNAAAIAHKQNHKTFTAGDVFTSIDEMDFKSFLGPMKSTLTSFRKTVKDKRDTKKQSDDKAKELNNSSVKMDTLKILVNTSGGSVSKNETVKVLEEVITIDDDSD